MNGETALNQVLTGNCYEVMQTIPDGYMDMAATSPPYWGLRDYGIPPVEWPEVTFCPMPGLPPMTIPAEKSVHGLEKNIWAYVAHAVLIFREVRRVLADRGTLWLNLGDCYAGSWGNSGHRPELDGTPSHQRAKNVAYLPRGGYKDFRQTPPTASVKGLKPKDLVGITWRVAFALQADGWWLRSDIIWHKPNPMPESVTDRPTKAHEYVFLLAKSADYFYDAEAIKEEPQRNAKVGWKDSDLKDYSCDPRLEKQGSYRDWRKYCPTGIVSSRNKRTVWTITTQGTKDAHFATFPPKLVEPMILAGCPREACTVCGKPRERVVEKRQPPDSMRNRGPDTKMSYHTRSCGGGQKLQDWYDEHPAETTGWTDCGCGQGFRPGRVLDPFGGSGTVGYIAAKLKRDWLLIEMNPKYVEDIARARLEEAESGVSVKEQRAGQLALFSEGNP